jgi:AcrR family transcriptional regulator
MPKGIPLTEEEQEQRRRYIYEVVVNLIQEKGFQETSMREIAEAAGMGKSTLYDYFKTKDEILFFIFEEQTEELLKQAQKIAALDLPPQDRLRRIMHNHVAFMYANRGIHTRIMFETQRLKLDSQKRINAKRYAYQDVVAGIIADGIASGCFRPVTPLSTARLLINSLLSVLYTTRPTDSVEKMLDEAVDIFLHGISK